MNRVFVRFIGVSLVSSLIFLAVPVLASVTPFASVTFAQNIDANDQVATAQTANTVTPLSLFSTMGFLNSGFHYVNWNTDPAGIGQAYTDGQTYNFALGEMVLYAQWTENSATFNENASSSDTVNQVQMATTSTALTQFANLSPAFVKANYQFTGWNTSANGTGTALSNGASFNFAIGSITLYAQWELIPIDTAIFSGNGGSTSTTLLSGPRGSIITLPGLTGMTYAGYSFNDWNTQADGLGTSYTGGSSYVLTVSLTLYAQWIPDVYVLTLVPGGGSVSPALFNYTVGTGALALPTAVLANYNFDGWFSSASGGTLVALGGGTFTPVVSLSLYAQWTPVVFTLTYNAEGGAVSPASVAYTYGTGSLTLATPTLTNYLFSGWYSAASGGGLIGLGGVSYTPSNSLTLFAQWSPAVYTVTYNAGAGTVSPTSANFTYATSALVLPTPTLTGSVFDGWFSLVTGGTLAGLAGASYSPAATLTLYAHWHVIAHYSVTFVANGASGTQSELSGLDGSSVTLPGGDQYTNIGFLFTNWNSAADGSGTPFSANTPYLLLAASTLYAQWVAAPTITIRFDPNGGTGAVPAISGPQGTSITLPGSSGLANPGNQLSHWNTVSGGIGTTFALNGQLTLTTTQTLYAQWTANPVARVVGAVGPFAAKHATLTNRLKTQILNFAKVIRTKHYTKVTLYGYATGNGTAARNHLVSLQRANAVASYLRGRLAALKVKNVAVKSVGQGGPKGVAGITYTRVEVFAQ